jgi:transcriptional regulator GlxA family with amidase domain
MGAIRNSCAIKRVVELANIPERTLKRRFKAATGATLIEYLQNLRIEEAKRLLESGRMPVDDISVEAGYEDPSFSVGYSSAARVSRPVNIAVCFSRFSAPRRHFNGLL